jgi:hypothetical protein
MLLTMAIRTSQAQGCSDAGACSAGSLGLHDNEHAGTDLLLGYSQSVGLADKESLVFGSEFLVSHHIFPSTNLEVRIPYLITVGNLGTTSGVGDLMITLSQVVHQGEKSSLKVVAGGRLKTNDANKKADGQPLPMVYQSSLGTNDIIAGLAWQSEQWSISMAYQHPFGNNLNEYLRPDSNDVPERELYYESAFLKRGDDLMIRIQRTLNINAVSKLIVGALPIYRLQQDEIRRDGEYEKLPGSDGITFNLYVNWFRSFGENKLFNLSLGVPLHAREYRADGLTRTAIISAGLVFKFRKSERAVRPIPGLYEQVDF